MLPAQCSGHSSAAKNISTIGCPLSKGTVRSLKMQGKSIALAKAYQITERYEMLNLFSIS